MAEDPRIAEAKRLYVPGIVGYKRVAKLMGVSEATVRRLVVPGLAERDRIASRGRKAQRTGSCVRCGAETKYGGVRGHGVSPHCVQCGKDVSREAKEAERGTGPLNSRILAALADGPMRRRDLETAMGTGHNVVSVILHRLLRYGMVVRVSRGVYALAPAAAGGEPSDTTPKPRARVAA